MMAVPLTLSVFKDSKLVEKKEFDRDLIKIGRLASAHLCIEDERVARIHAVIETAQDGTVAVVDMGSAEGTFVGGRRIAGRATLRSGDEIRLGGTTLRLQVGGASKAASPTRVDPAPVRVVTAPVAAAAASQRQVVGTSVAHAARPAPREAPVEALIRPPNGVPSARSSTLTPSFSRPHALTPSAEVTNSSGNLGLELRFMWGDQNVGEYYMHPREARTFVIGATSKSDFEMGEGKLGGPSWDLVQATKAGFTVRIPPGVQGEWQKRGGADVVRLQEVAKSKGAVVDNGALSIAMGPEDFVWADLGGVVVEMFFQPQPEKVKAPLTEALDFTVLNIFLFCFFIAALFVITVANRDVQGESFGDDVNPNEARIAKLLIKPPENQKNPIIEKYEAKKDTGEAAAKAKGDEGKMGKKEAPERSARTAPKGDVNSKDEARALTAKLFGGKSGGISTVFGHEGKGGALNAAVGNLFGATAGDAKGIGGLGLRGTGSGGGGIGDTIGIGAIGTKGRGGGTGTYGAGAGVLGGKKSTDVSIKADDIGIVGSLDKELIRQVIHRNRGQIRYCFDQQLSRFPNLNGKVAVKFIITPEGTVSSSTVSQSTLGNSEMEKCVADRILGWAFPKPKGAGVVIVTYPFIFKPAGQ